MTFLDVHEEKLFMLRLLNEHKQIIVQPNTSCISTTSHLSSTISHTCIPG
jgi:hypothetical protein